jgi:ATP-dependent helicase HrpB
MEHRVRAALDLDPAWLAPEERRVTTWDPDAQAARGKVQTQVGAILCQERAAPVDSEQAAALLLAAASDDPERALAPSEQARALQARMVCLAAWRPDLGLPATGWAQLLPRLCSGRKSFRELRQADLVGALLGHLDRGQREALDKLAPPSLTLPSGTRRRLRYEPGRAPVLSARIQQCFGWHASPRIAGGQVTVVIELLAPNQRPVQVTADLESFWTQTWPQVRKELRGRYAKHPWPEDPWTAQPTDRAKPRKR